MGLSALEARGEYLVSSGCMVHYCGFRQAAFSVNTKSGVVDAVLVDLTEKETLQEVKWLTTYGKPLAPLQMSYSQLGGAAVR